MSAIQPYHTGHASDTSVVTNLVLRNTYLLLAMTLLFGAALATISAVLGFKYPGILITLAGYFALLILIEKTKNSAWGLLATFTFAGFLGATLGPALLQIAGLQNGPLYIFTALGGTGIIFLGLSLYILYTLKDFTFLRGALFTGAMTAFFAVIVGAVFEIQALHLAGAAVFIIVSSGLIMYQVSRIINGGEHNYISATVLLYVSIYNIFASLLHLFVALGDD